MHNPIIVIVAAALAAWIFGAVWYGALGKVWQRAQGLDPEQCKGQKMPLTPMVVSFVSELVMAFIFARLLSGLGVAGWQDGAVTGLLIGIGFMATTTVVNNMFKQHTVMLSLIDGAHWIGVAAIQGAVLAALS
jgi:Protein of unknown function (DUF1761)